MLIWFSIFGKNKEVTPRKVLAVLNKDTRLKKITHLKLAPLNTGGDVFQDLIKSVVGQQLSGAAAATIYNRFLALNTKRRPTPRKVLNLDIEKMRHAGLSYSKASYIKNIAQAWISEKHKNTDWEALSDEEVLKILTAIKGVGNWTAQMIMIFTLHRDDVFPTGDVSVQHSIKEIYKIKAEGKELIQKMEKKAKAWGPYRSWASRYFWAYRDQ